LGKEENAKIELSNLMPFSQNTYVIVNDRKVSFEELAMGLYNQFKNK